MKLLMVLKSVDMQWEALRASSDEQQRRGLNMMIRYMRRSGLWFDDLALVTAKLTGLTHKVFNRPRVTPRPFNVFGNLRSANVARRRNRTIGVRAFSKIYRVRGLLLAFGALHRNRIKLHMETPNVKCTSEKTGYIASGTVFARKLCIKYVQLQRDTYF